MRISIKDYRKNKNLKVLLLRAPQGSRQFLVRMNPDASGQATTPWPKDRRPVSLTRVLTELRKAVVRAA